MTTMIQRRSSERMRAAAWGLLFTAILAVLILIGSRNLDHFDAALVGYTFSVLFATFGVTYRYSMWLQKPPTKLYWRRGWQTFFQRRHLVRNSGNWFRRVTLDFVLNRFIAKRDRFRWVAHFCIMWGCIIAFAITFPLVFGWIHFQTVPGDLNTYQIFLFGFPTQTFPVDSIFAFMIFHGLVWASWIVIAGVMVAMRRRMREHGAAAVQMFGEDFLPLIMLFAISVTGLMLTASYSWMKGYAFDFLAILHAITVIFFFLWLPFGKFFHIFQRPAQLGVSFYKDVGPREGMASCRRCNAPFASALHVNDMIEVERQLGFSYEMDEPGQGGQPAADHYQQICPACRRSLLAIAQGRAWARSAGGDPIIIEGEAYRDASSVPPGRHLPTS
jgi:hypothetical protein